MSINILFPAQIDNTISIPVIIDGLVITAEQVNTLRAAVLAIESALGVNPASVYGTVRARLDALENLINNQETITLTGDLGGTLSAPKVVGIQGVPVVATHPTINQALIFNGSFWAPTTIIEGSEYILSLEGPPEFVEVGQVIMNPVFFATYSNTPITATIQDNVGGPNQNVFTAPPPSNPPGIIAYNQSYTAASYTNPPHSVIFTLTSNDGVATATTTTSITWVQNVYFGVGTNGQSSASFIKSLTALPTNSKTLIFTVNAQTNQYIYFAYRTAYGAADFWAYGWEGGFNLISTTIAITNSQGFTENYTLYRSSDSNLGETTVNVF